MDKKLISEITKIQSMMGILVEQDQPLEPLVSGDLTIKYSNFAPDTNLWSIKLEWNVPAITIHTLY